MKFFLCIFISHQGTWWYKSIQYSCEQILLDTTQLYYYFFHKTPARQSKRMWIHFNYFQWLVSWLSPMWWWLGLVTPLFLWLTIPKHPASVQPNSHPNFQSTHTLCRLEFGRSTLAWQNVSRAFVSNAQRLTVMSIVMIARSRPYEATMTMVAKGLIIADC